MFYGVAITLLNAFIVSIYLCLYEIILRRMSALSLGALGWTIALLLLTGILWKTTGQIKILVRKGCEVRDLIVVGLIGAALNLLLLMGLQTSSPINAGILGRSDILFGIILGWVFLKERLTLLDGIAAVLMVVGSIRIIGISLAGIEIFKLGDLFFVLYGLLLAVNAILIRGRLARVPNMVIAVYNVGVTAVAYLLLGLMRGRLWEIPAALRQVDLFPYLIPCCIAVAIQYPTYYKSLELLPVWMVRTILLFTPIFVTLESTFFFKDRSIGVGQITGLMLVLLGATIIIQQGRSGRASFAPADPLKAIIARARGLARIKP